MTGCDNFCSYCAVPHTRGREQSRPVKEIIYEIQNLAQRGCLEITLLGQNVNSFNPPDPQSFSKQNPFFSQYPRDPRHPHRIRVSVSSFPALLWEINQITGLKRLHFTASHPKDMTEEVIDALKLPQQVNYLHLPLQSGDNEVLNRMNRHYTGADYFQLIQKIRRVRPKIALGTDIIVGFPGETEKQFQNTVKFYKKIKFDIAYLAQYSPRPGTLASRWSDDVPRAEKKRRWQILQDLMEKITLQKNQKYLGKTASVLVNEYKNGINRGNSLEMKQVSFPAPKDWRGKTVPVKIKKALTWELRGELMKYEV